MKCPECHKEMIWLGDNDTMDEDVYVTLMNCNDCNVDMNKYWGDGIDKNKEDAVTTLPNVMITKQTKTYEIDFGEINTLDDVINILMGLNIKFVSAEEDVMPYMKKYLKECDSQ